MNIFEFNWRSSHTLFCKGLVVSILVACSSLQGNLNFRYKLFICHLLSFERQYAPAAIIATETNTSIRSIAIKHLLSNGSGRTFKKWYKLSKFSSIQKELHACL